MLAVHAVEPCSTKLFQQEVVDETEDVDVVLELNVEVVDTVGGRIPERMPETNPADDVAGVFLSLSFPAGFVGVGVGVVSKVNQPLKKPSFGREGQKTCTRCREIQ